MVTMLLFGMLIGWTAPAINTYPDCLKENFENPACKESKVLYKIGEKSCSINGKKFDGSVCK